VFLLVPFFCAQRREFPLTLRLTLSHRDYRLNPAEQLIEVAAYPAFFLLVRKLVFF